MIDEVSRNEIVSKYRVLPTGITTTGWTKDIKMAEWGSLEWQYTGRLHWDSHDGYSIYWDTVAPPEADRPEFEYILDSITEGANEQSVLN